jgi:hypothetical protein
VKGDNAFVSAPAGWTAVLGEPDAQTNIAVLTLKAPAESAASTTLGRAATADNTKDLTVQVNKGVAWAVDKIQVEATKVISSYYDLFVAGEAINIEGIELKKSDWESVDNFTIKQITSAGNGSDENKITQNGIYFIQPGASAAFAGSYDKCATCHGAAEEKAQNIAKTLQSEIPAHELLLISAKENIHLQDLKDELSTYVEHLKSESNVVITNQRHYESLQKSIDAVYKVKEAITHQISTELLAYELRNALEHLGEISGEFTNDEVLGNIFSKFCIGK